MPLHRCLIAGLVGSILALGVIISLSACSPVTPTTSTSAVTATSPTPPTPTATPTPAPTQLTTIYFLVDRSNSMKNRCPYTETLYQLPGFFTQVGAVINETNGSPSIFVSEIWFPKPDIDAYPPIPASEEVGKEFWRHEVSGIENQKTNEYGEALNQVWKYLNAQSNNVIVVLTDGTFSENIPDRQRDQEAQSISEELYKLSKAGVKVHLVLCGTPREEESPWLGQEGLVGSYNLEDLGQITSLGNALFGEDLSRHQYNVKLGWLTGTTSVTLPGETITFTANIATVGWGNPWIDYSEARSLTSCDSGLCKLERGFERFSRPAHSCEPQEIEIHLGRSLFGFYLLKGYTVPPWEYQVEPSVNLETATLTISLKTSPHFDPQDFEKCFSAEIESEIIAGGLISAQFRDTHATLVWQPQSVEPGDYEGSLRIKSIGGQVVASWPITLLVRFNPLPLQESITATPSGEKSLSLEFKYQYVPPGVSPMVFLCSDYTPDEITNKINPYIDCGKAPCGSGHGMCSIVCPTPIPCPQEVSRFCQYCVPINAGQMDASRPGCIQSGDNSGFPNKFQQEFKMTLVKCLAWAEKREKGKESGWCGYSSLLIYWPDHSKVIPARPDIYRRNVNAWERK
jgi:hypothetical protein